MRPLQTSPNPAQWRTTNERAQRAIHHTVRTAHDGTERQRGGGMSSRATKKQPGRILFVGSGPGDPALLTVRAREVIGRATLAFTDPDVDKGVLALIGTAVEPAEDGERA